MATIKKEMTNENISIGLEHFDDQEESEIPVALDGPSKNGIIKKQPRDLDKFLNENYNSTIIKLNGSNFDDIKRPLIISFHHYNDKYVYLKKWIDELYKEALKYKGTIQFAIADSADVAMLKLRWNVYHGYIYCDPESFPEIYAIDKENRKYTCIDISLTEFSKKLHTGELFFSEALPATNDELVKVGVANNFETLLRTGKKDVFISFYATWSSFTKELLTLLNQLAELLKDENVLVVKMDAEANYVPLEYYVFNYPKLFLVSSADKNKYVEYTDGPITLEKLIKFIAGNVTKELRAYDRKGCPR